MIWRQLYRRLLAPRSHNEDYRRRELILNVLLTGTIGLAFVTLAITLAGSLLEGERYGGLSPLIVLVIIVTFIVMLALSRIGFSRPVAYVFIGIFLVLSIWPMTLWGILLPQCILMCSLVIVMTGVLLNSRTAFYLALVMFGALLVITHLHEVGSITYDTEWMERTGSYPDVIVYGVTFAVIALVAWLSNRETERSLARAQASEKALLKERQLLEVKVKERTQELEKAQVEKMMDLQRFAEFGRLSSTLMHELANPLMAVSIDLEQLEGKSRSKLLGRARDGIAHMERYVEMARRQLRKQSEIRTFNVAEEIRLVGGFLQPKATAQQVMIHFDLSEDVTLKGDSIRFNHIVSNLISNAIDAYENVDSDEARTVWIVMKRSGKSVKIVVRDFGKGISKEQLPHLFEPFYTTKQVNRGTGLGLAIVKQAVEEAFGGTVMAERSKDGGTEFTVRLPI